MLNGYDTRLDSVIATAGRCSLPPQPESMHLTLHIAKRRWGSEVLKRNAPNHDSYESLVMAHDPPIAAHMGGCAAVPRPPILPDMRCRGGVRQTNLDVPKAPKEGLEASPSGALTLEACKQLQSLTIGSPMHDWAASSLLSDAFT